MSTLPARSPVGLRAVLLVCAGWLVMLACVTRADDAPAPRTAVRVCSDPGNLPFSNQAQEGFENRVADLIGEALGLPVTYYFVPQRINFVRNTLRYKLPGDDYPCDVILGMPVGVGVPLALTRPWFRSTHAFVYVKGRKLDGIRSADDLLAQTERLRSLRIGVYDRSPASAWLAKHGLVDAGVPFRMLVADPDWTPSEIVDRDLVKGDIDAAIVWGPVAGWSAVRAKGLELAVVALRSEPGVQFDFEVAMAVRSGETAWRDQLDAVVAERGPQIAAILDRYGVPRVDANGDPLR